MKSNGQLAYEAYHRSLKSNNSWQLESPEIQNAWEAAGNEVQTIAGGAMHGIGYHDGWIACMERNGFDKPAADADDSTQIVGVDI